MSLPLVTPRTVPHGHLCTHPRHAAPADPGGWLRVWLPHPGPLPARGAVEAKPVKPKKLLGGCRASQAADFFQAAGFQAEWKPALKCWAWLPTSRGPGFPCGFPRRGTCTVSRTPAPAHVCTDALSPCAWPGGMAREEHTGQLHTTPMCWASAGPWDWLSAPPQRSQGRGRRGRWQLGHLQKSPCLPQVLEAPVRPSAKAWEQAGSRHAFWSASELALPRSWLYAGSPAAGDGTVISDCLGAKNIRLQLVVHVR